MRRTKNKSNILEEVDYYSTIKSMYGNGIIYDLQQIASNYFNDIKFWVKWAAKSDKDILELGCGTGRIGMFLIDAGVKYTGLDIVEEMLFEFKRKLKGTGKKANLIFGDMRNCYFKKKFDSILIPYNTFMHMLSNEDAKQCLSFAHNHLKNKGIFIFDIFNPDLNFLSVQSDEKKIKFRYPKNPLGIIETSGKYSYDRNTRINHYLLYHRFENGEEIEAHCKLRQYFPQEINALLDLCGFKVICKFGDFNENEFKADSSRQIIVCRKK